VSQRSRDAPTGEAHVERLGRQPRFEVGSLQLLQPPRDGPLHLVANLVGQLPEGRPIRRVRRPQLAEERGQLARSAEQLAAEPLHAGCRRRRGEALPRSPPHILQVRAQVAHGVGRIRAAVQHQSRAARMRLTSRDLRLELIGDTVGLIIGEKRTTPLADASRAVMPACAPASR